MILAFVPRPAPGAPVPGQIVVAPGNPSWFVREDGSAFFLCGPGDPEGFLYRGSLRPDGTRAGDQDALIDKLIASGANAIYVMAVRSHGGDGDATQNPFVDHDPSRGVNHAVLDQWEGWITRFDDAGIVVFLILYDDSCLVWDTGDLVMAPEAMFVNTLVDRFEHHANLVWCVAEEYGEALSRQRVEVLAKVIGVFDQHDHPIAVHQNVGTSCDFANDPEIDQFAVQLGQSDASSVHADVLEAWDRADGRYQLNLAEFPPLADRAAQRRTLWAAALGGAYVMVLGMDIASTPMEELEDCARLSAFLESTDVASLAPHDELAYAGTQYVLANPGDEWVLYSADAGGSVGLRDLPGNDYALEWLDPGTGATVTTTASGVSGDVAWNVPGGLGSEVALVVRRVDPSTPAAGASLEAASWGTIKGRYAGR